MMTSKDNSELKINKLSDEIQQLIDLSVGESERWKKRLNFLFRQLERVQDLGKYTKNPIILQAYLTLMNSDYKSDLNVEKLRERISKEIKIVSENIRREKSIELQQLSNSEFLALVRKKIDNDEITIEIQQREGENYVVWGITPKGKKINLAGMNAEEQTDKLLKKHGLDELTKKEKIS